MCWSRYTIAELWLWSYEQKQFLNGSLPRRFRKEWSGHDACMGWNFNGLNSVATDSHLHKDSWRYSGFSLSPFHHHQSCRRILTILWANQFYLSRQKTVFFVDMENLGMDLLGIHIQNGGISITKNMVDGFVALRSLTDFAELDKTFTWLTDHLPWASDISAPLHELSTSKDWEWTTSHKNAFKGMGQIISGSEVLTPFLERPQFALYLMRHYQGLAVICAKEKRWKHWSWRYTTLKYSIQRREIILHEWNCWLLRI